MSSHLWGLYYCSQGLELVFAKMKTNPVSSPDAAMALLFQAGRKERGASEFCCYVGRKARLYALRDL